MKRIQIVWLLTSLLLLFPIVEAQVVFETEIKVNNEIFVEHSTVRNHQVKIVKGDSVKIIHTLYNYFDADWVDIDVSYSVGYGQNLISEVTTSGLHTFWNQKGEWTNFEFYFVAEDVGKVWILFYYNGTYWEQFPVSQLSVASFSSLRFEIVEKSIPFTPILVVIVGVAVILVSSVALFYKKKVKSSKTK